MTAFALTGSTILTAQGPLSGHALLINQGIVTGIVPHKDIPADHDVFELDGATLTPGLIDTQINGGGGYLFNDQPTKHIIEQLGQSHGRSGTTGFLPTLISDSFERMEEAWHAAHEAIEQGVPGCLGLHLEGPFLNEARKGIHNADHFRPLDDKAMALLTRRFPGKLLLTIAPEQVDHTAIQSLVTAGVVVAAGHTAATYQETHDALAAGVTGFTHLFNAMPPMLSREPGPVAAALESKAWCSLIADGHHVDPAMMRLAHRAKTDGRILLVTDAMAAAGTDATEFSFEGKTIHIKEGRCTDEAGTLAGSNLTMDQAVRNAIAMLQVPFAEAVRMASQAPAQFLGLDRSRGTLAAGKIADITIFWPNQAKTLTIINGDSSSIRGL